jgi:hypothetical protein
MKRLYAFLGTLMLVSKLQADPSVDWISDSYSSFDVVLSGTGLGWSGSVTSPSGLWSLSSANIIQYPSSFNPTLISVENVGEATFLGQLPSQFIPPDPSANPPFSTASISVFGGYQDYFPVAPLNDGNPLNDGYLANLYDSPDDSENWEGNSTISITSIPSINDVSTWTWTAEYEASGASLEGLVDVPEPKTIAAFSFIIGIASIFLKRQKHGNFLNLR